MRAEADHAHHRHGQQAEGAREGHLEAAPPLPLAENQEGQHEPGRELDADAAGEREGGAARARRRAERQPRSQGEDHERVVVGAADGQDQQHRVQAEEDRREGGRAAESCGGAGCEPHGAEAADGREHFQRPQRPGQAEGRRDVAGEREQRPVGRVLERPADEAEHGVGRGFGGKVRVGVQAVQGAHAGEGDVAERVLGDQGRPERDDHVGRHDPRRQPPQRYRTGACQHHREGAAGDEHQHLETGAAEVRAGTGKRARQPARPAAAVGGDVPGGRLRGVEHEQQQRGQQCQQPGRAAEPEGSAEALRAGRGRARAAGRPGERRWPGRLHEPILTAPRPAGVQRPMYPVCTAAHPGTPGPRRAPARCNPRWSAG